MSEYILNLLPLHQGEREEFESIAPDAVHVCARSSTVTPEQIAAATVIFGWPRPEMMKGAVSLKWFQTMWAGTDEYDGALPQGILFTSSSGSNSLSVAEHMLDCWPWATSCPGIGTARRPAAGRIWGRCVRCRALQCWWWGLGISALSSPGCARAWEPGRWA